MFEKLKNMLKIGVSFGDFKYVVDIKTFEEFLREDLKFTIEYNLEACTKVAIHYKGEKHVISIWNYAASKFKDEQKKGLSVMFDEVEYNSLENLFNNATICNIKVEDIKDYFLIELLDGSDRVFLNEYKEAHPELKVEDYESN